MGGGVGGGVAVSPTFEACYFFLTGRQAKTDPSGSHWKPKTLARAGQGPGVGGGVAWGREGGAGAVGTHWKPLNTSKTLARAATGWGWGLVTHWKPLNTSKKLARAARVVGSVGGGVGAMGRWGRWGREGVWAHILHTSKTLGEGVARTVGALGAVGAVRVEGVWAHIGSL